MKKIIYLIPLLSISLFTNCNKNRPTGLCFTSQQDKSTINYETHNGRNPLSIDIEISKDEKTWTDWTEDVTITLNKGEKIYVRNAKEKLSKAADAYFNFVMDGKIAASGNVNSMINYGELYDYCYFNLFYLCDALTKAPELPSLTLAPYCYYDMFSNCSHLTSAPKLPATNLAEGCYLSMFMSCIHLTKPPVLPATTLTKECYLRMFENCFDLPVAPKLPATTLAEYCYYNMFYGCEDYLTKAPELPATTLAKNCYQGMFGDCLVLTKAPKLPATTLVEDCYREMFAECESLNYVKVGFGKKDDQEWPSDSTHDWLRGVADKGTFIWNGAKDGPKIRNGSTVPSQWEINP